MTARPWFLRADDVVDDRAFPPLARLLARVELPCLLAVIPLRADPGLAVGIRALATRARGPVLVAQHGSDHRDRAVAPARKDELGDAEPEEAHLARLRAARARLGELGLPDVVDVYVPPWNRVTPRTERIVAALGIGTISAWDRPDAPIDVTLDVQASYRPAAVHSVDELARRVGAHQGGGLLLHPELMNDADIDVVADVLVVASRLGRVRPAAEDVLRGAGASGGA